VIRVRKLDRENGIPDDALRLFPKACGELAACLPAWHKAAAIGSPGVAAEAADYVNGVDHDDGHHNGHDDPG
jgi:hypothetical protein